MEVLALLTIKINKSKVLMIESSPKFCTINAYFHYFPCDGQIDEFEQGCYLNRDITKFFKKGYGSHHYADINQAIPG